MADGIKQREVPEVAPEQGDYNHQFDRLKELLTLCSERIDQGAERDWLLDYNLPDLYMAIRSLYRTIGETDFLESHLPYPDQQS